MCRDKGTFVDGNCSMIKGLTIILVAFKLYYTIKLGKIALRTPLYIGF